MSHAHSDHFAAHNRIIASKGTARLIEARFRGTHVIEPHMFGRAWKWRGHRLMLLPAGHTLGSAQIHVTRLADGASLLYTGDFKIRTSRTAETARFAQAGTLIMETTFGLPRFRFPGTIKVRNALIRFCRGCLDEGEVPVLVAYALGKAQEIMAQLRDAGFSWGLHPACFEMTAAYEAQGIRFPPYTSFGDGADPAGKVLIVPPNAVRSQMVRRIKARRLAMCTGWAFTPGAKYRYQVDEVFPLSDHADYAELLEAVDRVQPQLVLTTHGYAAEFACDLRERGIEAWSLGADDQMEFSFGLRATSGDPAPDEATADAAGRGENQAAAAQESGPDAGPLSGFAAFVRTGDAVAATAARHAKIERLAAYFRGLEDDGRVAVAARFLSGRAVSTHGQQKSLAAGWPVIRLALLHATGISAARLRDIHAAQADAGRTACLALLHGQKAAPRPLALADITACIDRLLDARGSLDKATVLETYFRQMTPAEGQYLVKILTGDMRIGLKDGLMEEALAAAFDADPAKVREAHMLTGDLGETARLARRGELDQACLTLFQPLRPMLASTEATTTTALVWLEERCDGIRAQLHKRGSRVDLYSRDLRSLQAEFPEIVGPAARLADDVVLDGEIIAFADGRKLDSEALRNRLGRHERDLFVNDDVTVRYVVFDLLYHDGESLLMKPLVERRARLEALPLAPPIEVIALRFAASPEEMEAVLLEARALGQHGLIAKDPNSPYAAGRRSRSWFKL